MEPTPNSAPSSIPEMSSSPAAQPMPQPAPVMPPPPPMPIDAAPGMSSPSMMKQDKSIGDFLKNINWVETLFMVGFGTLMYFAIDYYRWKKITDKSALKKVQNDVDDLTVKIQNISTQLTPPAQSKGTRKAAGLGI